jgi:hypothetical protein
MRPNPEIRNTTVTADYVASNGYTNTVPRSSVSYSRNWSGVQTPGYPKVKKNNPHESKISVRKPATFTVARVRIGSPTEWDVWTDDESQLARPAGFSTYDLYHAGSTYEVALGKAMDEIADRKFQFAQFIAERKQVVSLITDTVERLTQSIWHIRRRNIKEALLALGVNPGTKRTRDGRDLSDPIRSSGSIASDWLSIQYGWRPLLSDVKGAAEHFAQNNLRRPLVLRSEGRAKAVLPEKVISVPTQSIGNFDFIYGESKTRAKVILEFEVANDLVRQGGQLGLIDPLSLAWELLPYSFVVDWFLPVGDFISRLRYDDGLVFKTGTYSYFSQNTCRIRANGGSSVHGGLNCNLKAGNVTVCDNTWLSRGVFVRAPRAAFPKFEDPFSPTRALNALALLRTGFDRKLYRA